MTGIVASYADWLRQSGVAKLFVNGEPGGAALAGRFRDFCRTRPTQQEDSPGEIGNAIAAWLRALSVHRLEG